MTAFEKAISKIGIRKSATRRHSLLSVLLCIFWQTNLWSRQWIIQLLWICRLRYFQ